VSKRAMAMAARAMAMVKNMVMARRMEMVLFFYPLIFYSYCMFDLNLLLGPWKLRITGNSQ
jgi:hypothetical protein